MKLILIDGNSLMYRAYYATAYKGNLMRNTKGVYTNAVYAFANMINKITQTEYDAILVAFDKGKKTFRHDILKDYKAGRTPMPDEMRGQIPLIKEMLDKMNIKHYEMDLYEADDIIGTMSKMAREKEFDISIFSSDKDLFQLIDDHTSVFTPTNSISELEEYNPIKINERYNLEPHQMIDLKALMGDASDNLKGVAGVGEKTAIKLLTEYGTLENILDKALNIKGALKDKIINGKEDALICKKMVTINRTSPIEVTLEDTFKKDIDYEGLMEFYRELEFQSLIKKLQKPIEQFSLFEDRDEFSFKIIDDSNIDLLKGDSYIYLENFEENYHKESLIGIGVTNDLGSFFIPSDLMNNEKIKSFFMDNTLYTYDAKKVIVTLNHYGITNLNIKFDLLLSTYIINQNLAKEEIAVLLNNKGFTGYEYDEFVYLSGAKKRIPDLYTYAKHISRKSMGVKLLHKENIEDLERSNQIELFNLELKLSYVLASMEIEGMKIDIIELNRQKNDLQERLFNIENAIFKIVGYEFNINSIKQLGVVLFEELKLPIIKKNKTGYSTDNEVLEKLKGSHPIIDYILDYRQLMKLYTTYIEGIRSVIKEDSCVHTIFKQALTQTGRLSSIEPNLQNISVRTLEGKEIRRMFVPKNDFILSFDYSQIELRVLAHMANVEKLIESFRNKEDIHEKTAKLVLNKSIVTKEERNSAKAINFGIIYGMSAWSLGDDLKIGAKNAQYFIDKYYEAYPEIKNFMQEQIEFCKSNGFVTTIKNRRRYISDIASSNYQIREFAKRTAMNAPIQGSAADILKMAMIDVFEALKDKKSRMISTVHDELIFDCTKDEIDDLIKIIKEKMENVIGLKVPLVVEGSYGKTWYEAK